MTRIAPIRSSDVRASDALVDARWRVGVRDSITLSILPGPEPGAAAAVIVVGSERAVLAGRYEESDHEIRFTFEAVPEHGLNPEASEVADLVRPADRRNLRRLSGFKASVCHGTTGHGAMPLLLTDLASRLGLMGGTYVLESIRTGF